MSKDRRIWQSAFLLFAISSFALITLTACITGDKPMQNPVNESENTAMDRDEIIEANATIFFEYFQEIELSEEYISREYRADAAAECLAVANCKRVVSVESSVHDDGSIDITVTDEEGSRFFFSIGKRGDIWMIEDEEGNIVYGRVE